MARPKKIESFEAQITAAEELVLKRKAAYDKAVAQLKELRDKQERAHQEALLDAVARSKWSYEKIMKFIHSDPNDDESDIE